MHSYYSSNNEVHVHRPKCGLFRPKISRPLFATVQRSTVRSKISPSSSPPSSSSSSSSSSSPTSTSTPHLTPKRLRLLATTLLTALATTHDLDLAASLIAPHAQIQHEDNAPYTSRSSFFDAWRGMLARAPGFRIDLIEAVADERERKVWIRGLATVCGKVTDCTVVMVFDEAGMCVRSWDQGMVRSRGDDERETE